MSSVRRDCVPTAENSVEESERKKAYFIACLRAPRSSSPSSAHPTTRGGHRHRYTESTTRRRVTPRYIYIVCTPITCKCNSEIYTHCKTNRPSCTDRYILGFPWGISYPSLSVMARLDYRGHRERVCFSFCILPAITKDIGIAFQTRWMLHSSSFGAWSSVIRMTAFLLLSLISNA